MSTIPVAANGGESPRAVLWQCCGFAASAPSSFTQEFLRAIATGVEIAGGELLMCIGSTVVCTFDAVDCDVAIDLFLRTRQEVADKGQPVQLRAGLAVGDVSPAAGRGSQAVTFYGSAIDAAQQLANAAQRTELLVNDDARERASDTFLFTEEHGNRHVRCHPLDLAHPRKRECRTAASRLQAASLADLRTATFSALRRACTDPNTTHVILRTEQAHDPVDWLDRLARELQPPLRLDLHKQAGAMQPLGSLQAALARKLRGGGGDVLGAQLAASERDILMAIANAKAVTRNDAVSALTALFGAADGRPWVVADRLHHVDPATLGVLAESMPGQAGGPLLLLSVYPDAKVPAALAPAGSCVEVSIPAPEAGERVRLAEAALGLPAGDLLARRVASLGEASTLGVLEACRTLVTSGDLVPGRHGFRWRTTPRAGAAGVPVDALLAEQLSGLSPEGYRTLEVLCLSPSSIKTDFTAAVAARDGMSAETLAAALGELSREGLIDGGACLHARERAITSAVRSTMPPSRSAELHRFIADAWSELHETTAGHRFDCALVAHHRAEGGQPEPAAAALLDAAEAAVACGFQRMGMRLSALAVQQSEAPEIRARTQALVRGVEVRGVEVCNAAASENTAAGSAEHARPTGSPRPASAPADVATQAVRAARRAIVERDCDAAERLLDTAVAAGWDPVAAERLRAVAQMAREDLELATQTIQRSHAHARGPGARAREAVAWSMLQLQSGEVLAAVRSAMAALSICRRQRDERGEAAALCMLSACYRALGDPARAARLGHTAAPSM
ncbi:MAG: hypothetical protein OXU20_10275 [Myxococcales bacterium]|nr:hypothetical protein [Myxococcales bacterium]MDD9970170.1 hypothetical protein [Myxococcales bacterium]